MLERCENENHPAYKNYGKRGIAVCVRWHSFDNFLADMGERPKRLTLERRHNASGYSPSNCVWAARRRQTRNTRQNRLLTFRGETMCVADWAERLNLKSHTIRQRLDRDGLTIAQALTTPTDDWIERRRKRRGTKRYAFDGERLTLYQWAERMGITRQTLRQRVELLGWPIRKALLTPVRQT